MSCRKAFPTIIHAGRLFNQYLNILFEKKVVTDIVTSEILGN